MTSNSPDRCLTQPRRARRLASVRSRTFSFPPCVGGYESAGPTLPLDGAVSPSEAIHDGRLKESLAAAHAFYIGG